MTAIADPLARANSFAKVVENRIAAGVIADPKETRELAVGLVEGVERVLEACGPGQSVEVRAALESVIAATYQLGTRLTIRESAVELVKRGRPTRARRAKARLDGAPERWLDNELLEQEAAGVILKAGEKFAESLVGEFRAKAKPLLEGFRRKDGWPSASTIKLGITRIKKSRGTL